MIQQFMADHLIELYTFALNIWREARGEPYEGKVAVACVVLDRVKHPKWWGKTEMEVILKPKQFSGMTFAGDPMTIRYPLPGDASFRECLDIAAKALTGSLQHPAPGADHYYSVTLPAPPYWADESKFVKQIGNHRFYNLGGEPPGEGQ